MMKVYMLLQRGQEMNQKGRIRILLRSPLFPENHYKRRSRSCTHVHLQGEGRQDYITDLLCTECVTHCSNIFQ